MKKSILCLCFLFGCCYFSLAQSDSLRKELFRQKSKQFKAEQALIQSGFRQSSIGQFILADSFSRLKDSAATAASLRSVDPAHLIAYWELQGIPCRIENIDSLYLGTADRLP